VAIVFIALRRTRKGTGVGPFFQIGHGIDHAPSEFSEPGSSTVPALSLQGPFRKTKDAGRFGRDKEIHVGHFLLSIAAWRGVACQEKDSGGQAETIRTQPSKNSLGTVLGWNVRVLWAVNTVQDPLHGFPKTLMRFLIMGVQRREKGR